MEVQQQERPPAYSHDPETLILPSVPQHDPASRPSTAGVSLPDIKSLGLPEAHPLHSHVGGQTSQWMSFQPHGLPSVPTGAPRQSIEPAGSPMEMDNAVSPESNGQRATSVMSVDDPETRMAAEALSGLRNMDFTRSPSTRSATMQSSRPQQWQRTQQSPEKEQEEEAEEEEPLLQLLTTSHPWIGNTINGSLSAYNTTKYYSPAFVRSSANFIERNIGSPVANTFGSVSRRTGIESGVRRYLGERRPSDSEARTGSKRKRVRESPPEVETPDIEKGLTSPPVFRYRSRTGSQASFPESLPAYDDNRSPQYEEQAPLVSSSPTQLVTQQRPAGQDRQTSHNWRTQLMITTSGLGVALHRNSLRSLKYCLRLLRNATDHVATIMDALKNILNEYAEQQQNSPNTTNGTQPYSLSDQQQAASRAISERIRTLGEDIMNTLKSVVDAISRYAGGALPENASALVRRQLMSVPQRWRAASESTTVDQSQQQDEAVRQGNRFLAFANQSLDMFAQISLVLSSTIESAEKWLESMGRKRKDRNQTHALQNGQHANAHQLNGIQNGEKSNAYPGNRMDFTMAEKR